MVKNLPANARDMGLIPGSGRSPGVGNGDLFQYTCLENPMDEEPGRLQCMKFQFAVSVLFPTYVLQVSFSKFLAYVSLFNGSF